MGWQGGKAAQVALNLPGSIYVRAITARLHRCKSTHKPTLLAPFCEGACREGRFALCRASPLSPSYRVSSTVVKFSKQSPVLHWPGLCSHLGPHRCVAVLRYTKGFQLFAFAQMRRQPRRLGAATRPRLACLWIAVFRRDLSTQHMARLAISLRIVIALELNSPKVCFPKGFQRQRSTLYCSRSWRVDQSERRCLPDCRPSKPVSSQSPPLRSLIPYTNRGLAANRRKYLKAIPVLPPQF
jgi:hypothetical protein